MFNKKSEGSNSNTSTFNITSGKNSINTQSTGDVKLNIKKDVEQGQ